MAIEDTLPGTRRGVDGQSASRLIPIPISHRTGTQVAAMNRRSSGATPLDLCAQQKFIKFH